MRDSQMKSAVPPPTSSPNEQPIRVLLADNHAVVRQGLRRELELAGGIVVVGETNQGEEVVACVQAAGVDVVILDIRLAGISGLEVTRQLRAPLTREMRPPSPAGLRRPQVLVFTAYADRHYALALLMAGARGYLLKTETPARVAEGVRQLAQGHVSLSQPIQDLLADWTAAQHIALSERELTILKLLARGLTNAEIGSMLGISAGTVQHHLHNSYQKLPLVRNRAEAVAWVWINRLIAGPN